MNANVNGESIEINGAFVDRIDEVIESLAFVTTQLDILREGRDELISHIEQNIDDEYIDMLFSSPIYDATHEYIENKYDVDLFDLYDESIVISASAIDIIADAFVHYVESYIIDKEA